MPPSSSEASGGIDEERQPSLEIRSGQARGEYSDGCPQRRGHS